MSFGGISLGCGNFGGIGSAPEFFGQGIDDDTVFAIMDTAWARGLRWFDTADAYGGGKSEELIGQWREEREPADLVLTTQVFHSTVGDPADEGLAPDRIRRQVEGSLARLGVAQIDLYLAHAPDPAVPLADTVATFESLREEGLIGAWGLSNHDAAAVREALAAGEPALVQNSFSLLERGDERDVIPLCAERDVAYVPFGPLAGGWLTGKYRRDEAFPAGSRMTQRPGPYEHLRTDAVFDGLDRLREEASERGVDMPTLAFAWVLAHPGVSGAVCGPMRPEQLEPVLAARDLTLTEADHQRIGGLFA
jgi:aryl-alcohol dehydrogenase-like predicted oxidoreductase